jgi:hypothetical protein
VSVVSGGGFFPSLRLLSSDAELNTAALAEGVAVGDPNTHP